MKLVTSSQMKALEQEAMRLGIDGLLLMENAARSFCDALEKEAGGVCNKTVLVCCGPGNNGGDGFAIGRHLHNRSARVTLATAFVPARLKGDAKKNYEIASNMELAMVLPEDLADQKFDIAVDALFGTGFHGEPEGDAARLISYMNRNASFVAAVDMPSGASADDGKVAGLCVQAHLTVTFGLAKPGQFLYPAKDFVGKLTVTDISIPLSLLSSKSGFNALDASCMKRLPERPENSHKGSFGKVLLLAGSPGMSGACAMAAEAVLRSGAGMVTAAVSKTVADTVARLFREMMVLSLPAEGDQLLKTAAGMVLEKLKNQDVLLAGCGLGTAEGTKKVLLSVIKDCDKPLVLDADGINLLKGNINIIKNKAVPVVLTPHPLEFSRISGHSMEYLRENRLSAATEFAKSYGVVLVLKGADTLVAHPDGRLSICAQSNSGLATAGSGDVLSGVIAALLAQGATPDVAADLGVYLHSRAGLLARDGKGAHGMIAGDILAALPRALKEAVLESASLKG